MKEYTVKYWTKEGFVVAIKVSAYSAGDAQRFVEGMPNFANLYCVDW